MLMATVSTTNGSQSYCFVAHIGLAVAFSDKLHTVSHAVQVHSQLRVVAFAPPV